MKTVYVKIDHPQINQVQQKSETKREQVFNSYTFQLIYQKEINQNIQNIKIFDKKDMGCYITRQNQGRHINYQLVSQYKIEGIFLALAINSMNNLIVVGTDSEIKIFNFKEGLIKLVQIIYIRGFQISILTYFKIRPFFISAQVNPSLLIWNNNLISNPKYICKLDGHSQQITCLVIHPLLEDLIITGSHDNSIKFWSIQTQWLCKQTISEHSKPVISLIINKEGTQLISCSQDKSILIIERSNQTQLWQIKQNIQQHCYGTRLSYITNSMFLFQPNSHYDGTHLYIFHFNLSKQQYEKLYQIPIKGRREFCYYQFPSVYIQSKNILLIKNGCFVNILKITPSLSNSDIDYQLEQTIEFKNKYINGTLSDNGEFLIIWDEETEYLQIRQLQYSFTNQ